MNTEAPIKGTLDIDGFAIIKANFSEAEGGSIIENINTLIDTGSNINLCSPDLFGSFQNSNMACKVFGVVIESQVLYTEQKSEDDLYETMIYFNERKNKKKIRFIVKPLFPKVDFLIGSGFLRDYCEFTDNIELNSFTFRIK